MDFSIKDYLQNLAKDKSYAEILLLLQMILQGREDDKSISLYNFLYCELYDHYKATMIDNIGVDNIESDDSDR